MGKDKLQPQLKRKAGLNKTEIRRKLSVISRKIKDKGETFSFGLFLQARYSPTADNPDDRLQKNDTALSELQLC